MRRPSTPCAIVQLSRHRQRRIDEAARFLAGEDDDEIVAAHQRPRALEGAVRFEERVEEVQRGDRRAGPGLAVVTRVPYGELPLPEADDVPILAEARLHIDHRTTALR